MEGVETLELFTKGRVFPFFFLLMVWVVVYYMLRRAEKGKAPQIRRVAALDAIDEAVGRATELGKSVLVHMGWTDAGLRGEHAGAILAGVSIMSHVAEMCARLGTKMIVAPAYPEVLPLVHETLKAAYQKEGRLEEYKEDSTLFFSTQQFPWAAGLMGTLEREKPGAHIGVGPFHGESLMIAEAGARSGAITILGTHRKSQIPFFIAACDYCLIGEEIYAAGAYLSKEPAQIGTIAGQDWLKVVSIALIVLGALVVTFGSQAISDLLKM